MAVLYISHWCLFVSFGQAKEKKKRFDKLSVVPN
jgi:hypothetical protein